MPENYLLPQKGGDDIWKATYLNSLRLLKKKLTILLVAHFSGKKYSFNNLKSDTLTWLDYLHIKMYFLFFKMPLNSFLRLSKRVLYKKKIKFCENALQSTVRSRKFTVTASRVFVRLIFERDRAIKQYCHLKLYPKRNHCYHKRKCCHIK